MNLSSSAHTDATRRKICLRTYAPCMQHTNTKSHNTIQQYSIHTNSIFVSRHTLCSTRHACMECRTISRGKERDKIYLHAARETGDSKDDTKIFVIVHKTLDTCYNFWMIDSWNADSAPHLLVLFHCSLVFFFFSEDGKECKFCHLCEPGEKKRRKKALIPVDPHLIKCLLCVFCNPNSEFHLFGSICLGTTQTL